MSNFDNLGYQILRGVFSESDLSPLRKLTDSLIEYSRSRPEDPFGEYYLEHRPDNGVLYDIMQRHPEFYPMATNEIILNEVEKALGPDIYLYVNSLLYKPRDFHNEVPWHQDFLSRSGESRKIIVWISMDKATRENGCLKVIPGSHKEGFRKWYRVDGATHHDRIVLDGLDMDTVQYVELDPGDVLLFDNHLIHASDENKSELPRRAYRVVYKGLFQNDFAIPRTGPIMVRGGRPDSLVTKFTSLPPNLPKPLVKPGQKRRKGLLVRTLNKIGRKLSEL